MRRFGLMCAALMVGAACVYGSPAGVQGQGPARSAQAKTSDNLIDINTATLEQMSSLPGMGAAYARRVMSYRPYTAKNQLVTRGVLPQETYLRISTLIIAKHLR